MNLSYANIWINLTVFLISIITINDINRSKTVMTCKKTFLLAVLFCGLSGLFNGLSWLFETRDLFNDTILFWDKAFTICLCLTEGPSTYFITLYLAKQCFLSDRHYKTLKYFLMFCAGTFIVFSIINIFTPFIFEIVKGTGYRRCSELPFYGILYCTGILLSILSITITILSRKNLSRENLYTNLIYPIFIIVFATIQSVSYTHSVTYLGKILALISIYTLIRHKNLKKIIIATILIFISFAGLIFIWFMQVNKEYSKWRPPEHAKYDKTLKVGIMKDNAPYSFFNQKGELEGFDVELAYEIGKKLNANIKIISGNWNDLYEKMILGECDLLACVTISEERDKTMELSSSYITDSFVLYAKGDENDFTTENKSIAILERSYESNFKLINKHFSMLTENHLKLYKTYNECMEAVNSGLADAALLPFLVGNTFVKNNPQYNILKKTNSILTCNFAMAAAKGNKDLISQIDKALYEMHYSGTLGKIQRHWFYETEHHGFSKFINDNLNALAFLLIATALATYFLMHKSEKDKEYANELKTANTKIQNQLEILQTMATTTLCTYLIDIKRNNFHIIKHDTSLKTDISEKESYDNLAGMIIENTDEHDRNKIFDTLRSTETLVKTFEKNDSMFLEHKNIDEKWIRSTVLVVNRDFSGKPSRALWYMTDITEEVKERNKQKQKEMEMHFAEINANRKSLSFASLFYLALSINIQEDTFNVLRSSILDEKHFSQKKASALLEHLDKIVASKFKDGIKEFTNLSTIHERIEGKPYISHEYINPAGLWVRGVIIPLTYDENGKLTEVIFAAQLIDDEKRKELELTEALKKSYEEAERANHAKTTFLSSMSHDIRTPLNAITGTVDILMNHTDNPKRIKEGLKQLKSSGTQLMSLINDILDISAIESGKLSLKLGECSLISNFKQYESLFQTQIIEKSLNATFNIHNMKSPWVICDEVRLRQIFLNLLSNSIKYTPAGGKIIFELFQKETPEGKLQTIGTIEDTGIGMSQEYMKKMWNAFSRADDDKIRNIQGTGLGLPIVKQLVDLMNGSIDVSSALDKGTKFTVTLPLKATEQKHEVDSEDELIVDTDINANILIAEDNDVNWNIASELLSLRGISTVRAKDGKEAFDLFTNSAPKTFDVILMDIQMPVMNGIEATKAIRESTHPEAKSIPIFAMTANAFTEDVERCLQAGMNEHLSKPIDIDKVTSCIKKYTRKETNGKS